MAPQPAAAGSLSGHAEGTALPAPDRHLRAAPRAQTGWAQTGRRILHGLPRSLLQPERGKGELRIREPRDGAGSLSQPPTAPGTHDSAVIPAIIPPAGRSRAPGAWRVAPPGAEAFKGPGLHTGLRDVAQAAPSHTACKRQSPNWNLDLPCPAAGGRGPPGPSFSPGAAGSG